MKQHSVRKILGKMALIGLLIHSIASISGVQAAQSNERAGFSQAELEQMLAPVALYPDSVLTHILIASTYPLEVVQASRWVKKHSKLKPAEAAKAVEEYDWDASVKALVAFPKILNRLSDDLEWTKNLGDAFLDDEASVLDSIQSLRQSAKQAGSLSDMQNVKIVEEDKHIIIQPVHTEYVYVPYYDSRVVYGSWRWSHYPPVYWHWDDYRYHYGDRHYYGWHPRVYISAFHFSPCAFHWRHRHIIRVHHHHYNHRRHYHRGHIIRHAHGQRWVHQPIKRRVAYRTEKARMRYKIDNRNKKIDYRDNNKRVIPASTSKTPSSKARSRALKQKLETQSVQRQNVKRQKSVHRSDTQIKTKRATSTYKNNNYKTNTYQKSVHSNRSKSVQPATSKSKTSSRQSVKLKSVTSEKSSKSRVHSARHKNKR